MKELSELESRLASLEDPLSLLAAFFEHAPTGFQIYDTTGHSVLVNRAFHELFGVPPPAEYCIFDDEIARRNGLLETIRRGFDGESAQLPMVWYDPGELPDLHIVGGRRVAIESSLFPIRDAAGAVSHVAFTFKDVTARETLVAREAEHQRAQRFGRIGNWRLDLAPGGALDANPLSWSEGVFRVFGYEPFSVEPTNELFFERVHPEDREGIRAAVGAAIAARAPYSFEHRIVRPDGTERVIFEHADVVVDAAGEPLRLEGIALDVTDRRRAESEAARFREIVEQTPDFVGIADAAGAAIYLNRAGRRMVGLGEHETLAGLSIPDFHPPETARRMLEEALPAAGAGGLWSGESELRHRDGAILQISQVVLSHRNARGEIDFYSTVARDVTEVRRNEELLRQSQKMEAIGELTGGIAHDFNNLLTVILGWAEFLNQDAALPAPQSAAARAIQDAGQRGAHLTRQLLAFSRRQILAPRPIVLTEVVAEVVRLLERTLGETIRIETELADRVGTVVADPNQIEQVLLNLAVNARDAMPGGGRLTIELRDAHVGAEVGAERRRRPSVPPGRYVLLSVADTGVGMSAEVRRRIFEPFFTTKEVGRGTGLGLATVYGIVQQSGGYLEVESEPGHGSVFQVYLPRVAAEVEAAHAARERPDRPPGGGEALLVVEDEPGVRELVASQLETLGYQVTMVDGPEQALARFGANGHPCDLVLTDLVMPGMGGRELVERLRALRPGLRVLYMSGYTDDPAMRTGVGEQAFAFLHKPFTYSELALEVRAALDAPADPPPAAG